MTARPLQHARAARTCNCGSGLLSEWECDARGIELGRMCDACRKERLSGYRADVLTDANYDADEQIEAEE